MNLPLHTTKLSLADSIRVGPHLRRNSQEIIIKGENKMAANSTDLIDSQFSWLEICIASLGPQPTICTL